MCIYLGSKDELTYETQEHVFPAGLGGCEKLEKGVVSDQANSYFSKIERNVLKKSLLQINRIIDGPGKRGSLSEKKATTSDVMLMEHNGQQCLGYMKQSEGYILEQIIICNEKIEFHAGTEKSGDPINECNSLIDKINNLGEKYVPIKLPNENENIIITYFKDKIYIASNRELETEDISKLKLMFKGSLQFGKTRVVEGKMSGTLEVEENIINVEKMVGKIAINTLAYIYGQESANNVELEGIKKAIFSKDNEIEKYVFYLKTDTQMKKKLGLHSYQHACIIVQDEEKVTAIVFIYDRGWQVDLGGRIIKEKKELPNGIICDWKSRKDYKYIDYILKEGVNIIKEC